MATQKDLDFTYSTLDQIFRMSLGKHGDFSGARYNGDFSLSLEEAQEAKHAYIADQLNIRKDSRVIDLGCGWGPFMRYAKEERGASCVGLTLSEGQYRACNQNGLEVYLKDCRNVKPDDFGTFDAVVSIGAFEHFASPTDHLTGKQEQVYKDFFRSVHTLLPEKGRFYLQTMVFGENMLPYEALDIQADKDSDAYMLALMVKQFPESWLPYGKEMVLAAADPYFKVVEISSGRLDYIETIQQWRKKFRAFNLMKYLYYLTLLPQYYFNDQYKYRMEVFKVSPNKVCFERLLMDHFRIVLEKR